MKEINLDIPEHKKSNLSLNEIKKYYPSLKGNGDPWIVALYEEIYSEQILTEFVSKTIDSKIVKRNLVSRYKGKYEFVATNIAGEQGFWIQFKEEQYKNISEINKFMDAMGWYPSYISNEGLPWNNQLNTIKHTDDYMLINYLQKYDHEVEISNLKYLYHVSPDISYKEKIEKYGLTPKNKSKLSDNPERIYFLLPTAENNIIEAIKALHNRTANKKLIKSWYILRIDLSKLPPGTKFYKDPMFEIGNGGVWTYQNIPPVAIQPIKKISINQ